MFSPQNTLLTMGIKMKICKYIAVLGIVYSGLSGAVDLGALDQTFSEDGTSNGWDISGEMGFNRYGSDVVVDSQGRIYVVGTNDYDFNGNDEKQARLERRLSNGLLDTSFSDDGVFEFSLPPASQSQFDYELALNSSDGVLVAYSRLFCASENACESDVIVYHVNVNGHLVGSQQIDFDLGSTLDRQDDDLADMVYVPSINKVAITAEVELTNSNDTDYGIAVLNVDPVSGALSVDTGFSVDGQRQCYFDHENGTVSRDKPEAIVYNPINNTFIVGGSTFEGNGLGADGWNMSFCEFDMAGDLVRDWSTESDPDALDDREFVGDMEYVYESGTQYLIIVGALPGAGDLDSMISRYELNQLNQWERDTSFGTNGTGYETVAYQFPGVGDTNDSAKELLIEEDGAILVVTSMSWENGGLPKGAVGLSKHTSSGHLDTNWGIGKTGIAVHVFDFFNLWYVPEAVAINPVTEEIYVVGFSYNGVEFHSMIANMHNDSIFGGNFDF